MKAGSPDNFQTDPIALKYLVPFISKDLVVWDSACGNGNLVKGFWELGYTAHGSDILTGDDFMECRGREKWDCIVTNPPFSIKQKFLGRCYNLGKPFALLMPITTFDSKGRRSLMKEHGVEIIFPPHRINFETPNHEANKAKGKKTSSWFYTAWFTHGFKIGRELTFID